MIDPETISNKAGEFHENEDRRTKRSDARMYERAVRKGWLVTDDERAIAKAKVLESLVAADVIEQPRSIAALASTILAMDKSDLEHADADDKKARLDNDEPTENVTYKLKFGGGGSGGNGDPTD